MPHLRKTALEGLSGRLDRRICTRSPHHTLASGAGLHQKFLTTLKRYRGIQSHPYLALLEDESFTSVPSQQLRPCLQISSTVCSVELTVHDLESGRARS